MSGLRYENNIRKKINCPDAFQNVDDSLWCILADIKQRKASFKSLKLF